MLHRKTLRIIYLKSFCIFMKILQNTYIKITESLITLPYVFKTNCFTHRKAVNKFGWEIHFWEWGQLLIYMLVPLITIPLCKSGLLVTKGVNSSPNLAPCILSGFCLGECIIIMGHLMGNHKGLACQLKERQAISNTVTWYIVLSYNLSCVFNRL